MAWPFIFNDSPRRHGGTEKRIKEEKRRKLQTRSLDRILVSGEMKKIILCFLSCPTSSSLLLASVSPWYL
jgi:hypothetical protein